MNPKRMVLAVAVVFVTLVVAGFLIHATWLGSTYQAMRDDGFSFRTPDAIRHRLWLVWLSDLLYGVLFVWVYNRGREAKPWLGQGLRFGVLMTLFTIVPSALNEYVTYNVAHMLVVKWMGAEGVVLVVLGLVVAAICNQDHLNQPGDRKGW
jgi:uncharacterized BrkB/YihY/UPF0761 family membrane protein